MPTTYPFVEGAGPTTDNAAEQLLARTWRATMSVVGADGLPPADRAGNVLRPSTSLKLSFRLPPTADADAAQAAITSALETDPPYGASVRFHDVDAAAGWNAPATAPWLIDALNDASTAAFGQPGRSFGEGGSIPFMGMLGDKFPDAQFVITGRTRTRCQRPRPQRVPPRPDRPPSHNGRRPHRQRPRP